MPLTMNLCGILKNEKSLCYIQGRILCGTPRLQVVLFLPFQDAVTYFTRVDKHCLNNKHQFFIRAVGIHGLPLKPEKPCLVAAVTLGRQPPILCAAHDGRSERGFVFL